MRLDPLPAPAPEHIAAVNAARSARDQFLDALRPASPEAIAAAHAAYADALAAAGLPAPPPPTIRPAHLHTQRHLRFLPKPPATTAGPTERKSA